MFVKIRILLLFTEKIETGEWTFSGSIIFGGKNGSERSCFY